MPITVTVSQWSEVRENSPFRSQELRAVDQALKDYWQKPGQTANKVYLAIGEWMDALGSSWANKVVKSELVVQLRREARDMVPGMKSWLNAAEARGILTAASATGPTAASASQTKTGGVMSATTASGVGSGGAAAAASQTKTGGVMSATTASGVGSGGAAASVDPGRVTYAVDMDRYKAITAATAAGDKERGEFAAAGLCMGIVLDWLQRVLAHETPDEHTYQLNTTDAAIGEMLERGGGLQLRAITAVAAALNADLDIDAAQLSVADLVMDEPYLAGKVFDEQAKAQLKNFPPGVYRMSIAFEEGNHTIGIGFEAKVVHVFDPNRGQTAYTDLVSALVWSLHGYADLHMKSWVIYRVRNANPRELDGFRKRLNKKPKESFKAWD